MPSTLSHARPNANAAPQGDLEHAVQALEMRLHELSQAVRTGSAAGIERPCEELHQALVLAVDRFAAAARLGKPPAPLRRRLASAAAEVAVLRDALQRSAASVDRALDVLLARSVGLYGPDGAASRGVRAGHLQA